MKVDSSEAPYSLLLSQEAGGSEAGGTSQIPLAPPASCLLPSAFLY